MKEIELNLTPVFLKNWEAIQAGYRYIINTGSSRSSKTFSLIDCCDLYARSNKNKRITVWRDTKTDCKKTVMNDALRHLKATNRYLDKQFNKTESIYSYPTGSTYEFHGTDDETTVHGLNQHVAHINEPYKISREVFDQIDQRTEDFIIIDWNPLKSHWINDLAKDPRAIVIHSTFRDNPFCPPNQREKILSYQPVKMCRLVESGELTEKDAPEYDITNNPSGYSEQDIAELSRCLENEYKRSASAFNWAVYGLGIKSERPNRIFHFTEITDQQYNDISATEYFYSDWGAVDPWAIGKLKYYDGAIYVKELNYECENSIRARLTPSERHLISGAEEGLVTWMFRKLDIPRNQIIVCDNNRTEKIRALREIGYDYAVAAEKPPGSIIDGIDLMNNLRIYYVGENIGHEQENYSRKVDRYGVVLEEPEDVDNHHMDGIRITCLFLRQRGVIRKI